MNWLTRDEIPRWDLPLCTFRRSSVKSIVPFFVVVCFHFVVHVRPLAAGHLLRTIFCFSVFLFFCFFVFSIYRLPVVIWQMTIGWCRRIMWCVYATAHFKRTNWFLQWNQMTWHKMRRKIDLNLLCGRRTKANRHRIIWNGKKHKSYTIKIVSLTTILRLKSHSGHD